MTSFRRWLGSRSPALRAFKRSLFNRQEEQRIRAAVAAVAAFPATPRPRKPSSLPGELIVSLTSYPPRFAWVTKTVKSLLDQTIDARLILWMATDDAPLLPAELRRLTEFGLEIRECDDLLSYKKIVPALEAFPNAFIVTADDDLYYPADWLERIVDSWREGSPEVIGVRGHVARFGTDGTAVPYNEWELETDRVTVATSRERLFLTGGAGILYPPRSLHSEVVNRSVFMELCPHADDVWLFCMAEMQGTRRRRIAGQIPLTYWPGSQAGGLLEGNVLNRQNDLQLAAVGKHYGLWA